MQQNNQLTNDRLAHVYRNLKRWAEHDNALNSYISGQKIDPIFHDCVVALAELQERRKADSEREQVRSAHAEWSQATFGDVGPVGPLKHLSKEAMEAASEPNDHSEWADMQFLLWDAQRRAGISDEQITLALVEKLAINKARQWPEPEDGEPRLHIKEQLVPVTLDEKRDDDGSVTSEFDLGWNACRAAMLQAGNHTEQHLDMVGRSGYDNEKVDCRLTFDQWLSQQNEPIDVDCGCVTTEAFYHWLRVAYEAGNSPVIPDGYVMVPKEPTAQMYDAGDRQMTTKQVWDAMLAAAPQQEVKSALEHGMQRYAGAMQKLSEGDK